MFFRPDIRAGAGGCWRCFHLVPLKVGFDEARWSWETLATPPSGSRSGIAGGMPLGKVKGSFFTWPRTRSSPGSRRWICRKSISERETDDRPNGRYDAEISDNRLRGSGLIYH